MGHHLEALQRRKEKVETKYRLHDTRSNVIISTDFKIDALSVEIINY
jgi:hypothetical protein